MADIRRRFNEGMRTGEARSELQGLGLSPGTASQLVREWEDHMPGFGGQGFEGLGEEQVVLRPNQPEKRRASREARNAELEDMRRFDSLQGDLFAAAKRKKSKYNGALVNTFPEGLQGEAPVGASVNHPSIRYRVLCRLVAPENRWLVASAFSGGLDSRLYGVYREASGGEVDPNVNDTGDNGRVTLRVDTGSGVSTEADLGGSLDTGYVVESLDDPLGIFPEGTVQGDFLEFGTVETILKALTDRGEDYPGLYSSRSIRSAASPGDHVELRFTSEDGSSDKFINMDYSGGQTFTATWGRFGSAGRQTEYPVGEWDAYYRGKTRKGYMDVTGEDYADSPVQAVLPEKASSVPKVHKPGRSAEWRQPDLFSSSRPQISDRFFVGRDL
jgi:predicted DNA-binding WGR domain protein